MEKKNSAILYGEVVAKCWEDEEYKKRFIEDPESVLIEAGIPVEEGVTYKVIEAPKLVNYIVLPDENVKPVIQEITKQLLNKADKGDKILPEGTEVRLIQNTEDTRYLILPASPKSLTKAELNSVFGGDVSPINLVAVEGSVVLSVVAAIDPAPPTVSPTAAAISTIVAFSVQSAVSAVVVI